MVLKLHSRPNMSNNFKFWGFYLYCCVFYTFWNAKMIGHLNFLLFNLLLDSWFHHLHVGPVRALFWGENRFCQYVIDKKFRSNEFFGVFPCRCINLLLYFFIIRLLLSCRLNFKLDCCCFIDSLLNCFHFAVKLSG